MLGSKQKPVCIFIPQNKLCAVGKTYDLLHDLRINSLTCHYLMNIQDVMPIEIGTTKKGHANIVMFAHYHPSWPNVKMLNNKFCEIDWNSTFNSKSLWFGHVCFGETLFQKYNIQNWVSYSDNISLIFGQPNINERYVAFFKQVITIVESCNKIEDIYDEIITLYYTEIRFLKMHRRNNLEYELLLPYIYSNLKKIRMRRSVAILN